MKSLAAAIALFYFASTMAAAPYGIKGQKQAATLYSNVHQFPNNQVTNMGGIDALVETGNNNILSNPSFEHLTTSSSWVDSGVETGIGTAVAVVNGKKALAYLPTAETINLTQSSTLYAAQFADGVQGLAMVRIKTDAALKVCSIQAGTVSSTNCVTTATDLKWGLYKVPFILGATSNGISISSNGASVSGTVIVDDAFVGAVDIKQDINNIGPWTSYTPQFKSTGTQPNIGSTGSVVGKWRQVGENIEIQVYALISGTGVTNGTGDYYFTLPTGYTIDTTKSFGIPDGSSNVFNSGVYSHYGTAIPAASVNGVLAALSDNISGGYAGQNFPLANWLSAGDGIYITSKIPVTQFSGATSVYSTPMLTNADRIGEVIQTTNSTAPQGFISALNKSIGQTGSGATYTGQIYYALYEHLWGIAGLTTTVGDVYRISSAKGASASADFAANKTITIDYETNAPFIRGKASAAGVGAYAVDAFQGHWHKWNQFVSANAYINSTAAGAEKVPFISGTGTGNGIIPAAQGINDPTDSASYGAARFTTETRPKNVSLNIFIRYAGDTQLITGQFNGLQSCTDTLACTDTFSATVDGSGITQRENANWINGNCTYATNTWSCPFVSGAFTVTPSCLITPITGASAVGAIVTGASSSSVSFVTTNTSGVGVQAPFNIICQKQGADYIGKTAMAVASDQNVRSVGSTNVDIQSVYFGSSADCSTACTTGNCNICSQVGNKITTVSYAGIGQYNLNGIDGTKYNCSGTGYEAAITKGHPAIHVRTSSSASFARVAMNGAGLNANTAFTSITCIGIP